MCVVLSPQVGLWQPQETEAHWQVSTLSAGTGEPQSPVGSFCYKPELSPHHHFTGLCLLPFWPRREPQACQQHLLQLSVKLPFTF